MPCGRLSRLSANILTTKFVMTKVDYWKLSEKGKLKIKTLRQKTVRWNDMLCIIISNNQIDKFENFQTLFFL